MPVPRITRFPRASKTCSSRREISLSIIVASRGAASTMVTGTPSAETMVAYSTPIAPPPTISSSRGLRSIPAMVSESNTHGSSKGTLAGRSGLDPVAMMTRSACSRVSAPSAARDTTVCSPSSRASPCTRCTPRSRIRSSVACRSCSLTRRARAATAGYITSGGADRATPYTFSFSKPLR